MTTPRSRLFPGLCLLALSLLPTTGGAASIEFRAPRYFPVGPQPYHIDSADFDGDGDVDLAVTLYKPLVPGVLILRNDGRGRFAPPRFYDLNPTTAYPGAIRAVDLDRDGDLDLVVSDGLGGDINVLLGDGVGGLGRFTNYPSGGTRYSFDLADFDGDGALDIVGATERDGGIALLRGNGAGGFAFPRTYPVAAYASGVVATDSDGDGRPDVAVTDSVNGTVTILLNDGAGSFRPAHIYTAFPGAAALSAADLTGDGRPDLIVGSGSSKSILVLRNEGGGAFSSLTPTDVGATVEAIRGGADLDRDGRADVVVAHGGDSSAPANVSILLGRGDGTFSPPRRFETGWTPRALAVADFDGDRLPDVVTPNFYGDDVTLLAGDGAGGLINEPRLPLAEEPFAMAAADFNHDGRSDLAVVNFTPPTIITGASAAGAPSAPGHAASAAASTPAADGPYDCSDFPMLVSIFLGASSGPPVAAGSYPLRCTPVSLTVADFNGDGNLDLATGNAGIQDLNVYVPPSVTVLLGDGLGSFPVSVDTAVSGPPASIAAVRANFDGFPDLAIATDAGTNLDVYLGDGTGSFSFWRNAFAGSQSRSLLAADINEDGLNDLVMAWPPIDQVGIVAGSPLGGFSGTRGFPAFDRPMTIALGDFNDDRHLDIVTAYEPIGTTTSELTMHRSIGPGVFGTPEAIQVGPSPASPVAADLDRDSHADLVALVDSKTVGVMAGDGSGRFGAARFFGAGRGARLVVAADFDSDGLLDLAIANTDPPSVSVLLNFTGADYRGGISVDGDRLSWSEVEGATGYDLVEGDLRALLSTRGDFTAAVTACLANDVPFTSLTGGGDPARGGALFFVVRPIFPAGPGTYDDETPGQVGSRDAGIGASPAACP